MRSVANQRTDPWVFQCADASGYDAQRAPGRPNAAKLCFLRYSRSCLPRGEVSYGTGSDLHG